MVSDRILSIAQVYMAAYSCELSIGMALLIGIVCGFVAGDACGWDKGREAGFDAGYEMGNLLGFQPKRDAKGRYSK